MKEKANDVNNNVENDKHKSIEKESSCETVKVIMNKGESEAMETSEREKGEEHQKKKHKRKHKSKRSSDGRDKERNMKKRKTKEENKGNGNQTETKDGYLSSDCESGTKTPLLDENENVIMGELPVINEIMGNKRISNENQLNKIKIIPNSNINRKAATNGQSRKKVSFYRDSNNIWRRQAVPDHTETYLASKLQNETKRDEETKAKESSTNIKTATYEFDPYEGLPNKYEINTNFDPADLIYDPEGKVEINTELIEEQSKINKPNISSAKEMMKHIEEPAPRNETGSEIDYEEQNQNQEIKTDNLEQIKPKITQENIKAYAMEDKILQNQVVKETSQETNKLQTMAKDLLITGVMPLCPPGRRDWANDVQYELPEHQFKWPPTDWQRMTPDRKLLAWEFAAMELQKRTEGTVDAKMSRAYILDKFNFLALPGTSKYVKDRSEVAASRARFYTYQLVQEVANGKELTVADESQINALNSFRKISDDFKLKLRTIRAPLRLNNKKE